MESRELLTTFTVTNNGDSGAGTLRDAINSVNAQGGNNTILFNLPSNRLVITPLTPLPALLQSNTLIDAETAQPGYSGRPIVTLSGAAAPVQSTGLDIQGGATTVQGLVITNWGGAGGIGIKLSNQGGDIIQGCYIGVDSTGLAIGPNGDGISMSSSNNTIGGLTSQTRNVIAGNLFDQITTGFGFATSGNVIQGNYLGVGSDGKTPFGALTGLNLSNTRGNQIGGTAVGAGNVISGNLTGIQIAGNNSANTIQGNFVGTDSTGKLAVGNTFDGIDINGAPGNQIGGLGNARNVISGNGRAGISISGAAAKNNAVFNNYIGVGKDGTTPLGNATEGIVVNGVFNVQIGGDPSTLGNVIANNGNLFTNYGINIQSGSGVQILSNSIYNNKGGGITIGNNANGNIQIPLLAAAESAAGQTNVTGSISAAPNASYLVQFFSSPTADPSGFGQGQTYLGEVAILTDGSGIGTIDTRLLAGVTPGQIVTATVTDLSNANTSSFAQDVVVTPAPVTNIQVSIIPSPTTALLGQIESYTVTVTNQGPNDATGVTVANTVDFNSTILNTTNNPLPPNSVINPNNPLELDTTIGNLSAGSSVTYTIYVSPNDVGTISLTSTASNMEIDSNTNPSATVSLTVNPAVDLVVSLNADPNPVAVGSPVTYVMSITNNGPSLATNVIGTLVVPDNATLDTNNLQPGVSVSADGKTVTFFAGNLPQTGTATLTVSIIPDGVGTVDVTASAASDEAELVPSNNSADLVTNVDFSTDLAVAFAPTPTTAFVGQPLVYVVTVTNNGPSDSTGAFLTDTLPAGVTFNSVVQSQGPAPTVVTDPITGITTITIAFGPIAAGGNATLTILVTPNVSSSLGNVAQVTNTTPDELDTNLTNNIAVDPIVLVSPVALSIGLTAQPEPTFVGNTLVYTIDVKNNGPADATNVSIADQLPAGVTISSITASDGGTPVDNGGLITYTFASIPNGGDGVITITVIPTSSAKLVDTASITGVDQINTNDTTTASVTSTVSPADLNVGIAASNATTIVGNQVTFTVNFGNSGPSDATNFVLAIPLPAGLSIASLSSTIGTATIDPTTNILTLTLPSLAAGATGSLTLVAMPTIAETATLTATVASENVDPNSADNSSSTAVNFVALPGTFNFSSPIYTVNETDGFITLTITRTDGISGDVVMTYATVDGTAKAGVNYADTAGGILFAAGVRTQTITIPIVHDGLITPNLDFQVVLTGSSSGGGLIGPGGVATVTIVNTDRDTISPQVTGIQPVLGQGNLLGFVIGFTKALDEASATNIGNYVIFESGHDIKPGLGNVPFQIVSATYDPNTFTVTLKTAVPMSLNKFYGVAINGSTASGVKDVSGNLVSGNGTGTPSDFDTYVGYGTNMTYVDASNNTVNIKITGGGVLLITRFANGSANLVQLININPHHTKLSGSVTHAVQHGKKVKLVRGSTVINSIVGLGRFGDVHSTLTTPGFYVTNPPIVFPAVAQSVPKGPIKHSLVKQK